MTQGNFRPTAPVTPAGPSVETPIGPIRLLVADDSSFMRKAITQLIESDPGLKVIDTARNGQEAVEKAESLRPDVVTLDIEMPVMNGHEALRQIRRKCATQPGGPPAVLVCSSLTTQGSADALSAMRSGAADVIAKDSSFVSANMIAMRDELLAKIRAVAHARSRRAEVRRSSRNMESQFPSSPMSLLGRRPRLIAIGSSTGGPPVLEHLIPQIPGNICCPVVIAQHMPAIFTKTLSERLAEVCQVRVVHGSHGLALEPGMACMIPGGTHGHLAIGSSGRMHLELRDEPASERFKPSVNVLLSTAAKCVGKDAVGIVLTGMGEDGKNGGAELLKAGGVLIAQDPESSVVYGMPKAAAMVGAVTMIPAHIAHTLTTVPPAFGRSGSGRGAAAA